MDKRIYRIKRIIKEECFKPENNTVWFYNAHLLAVEKNTKFLLARVPKANKEIVMLGAWLHDLQHVKKMKGNHDTLSLIINQELKWFFTFYESSISASKFISWFIIRLRVS